MGLKSRNAFYADDGKIFCNQLAASVSLQEDLDFIYAWTTFWLLPLNTNKNPRVQYSINNSVLELVDQVTHLGVILDNGLTFATHAAHIVKRANPTAYLLNRTFGSLDQALFKLLIVAFVRPILEYASVIWSPPIKKNILLIERAQRSFTKKISQLKNLSYEIF